MLSENLVKLYNTLLTIETKGDSTKTMGNCLMYLERLIGDIASKEKEEANKNEKSI